MGKFLSVKLLGAVEEGHILQWIEGPLAANFHLCHWDG